jgi:hypothetical protein
MNAPLIYTASRRGLNVCELQAPEELARLTDPEQAVKPPKPIHRRLIIKPIQSTSPRRIRYHRLQLTRRRRAVRTDGDLAVWCWDDCS